MSLNSSKKKIREEGTNNGVTVFQWMKNRSDWHQEWADAFASAAGQLEVAATLLAEVADLQSMKNKRPKMVARIRVFLDNMKGK